MPDRLRWVRRGAEAVWLGVFVTFLLRDGVPFDRQTLLVWIAAALLATSIGRRNLLTVLVDWVPFAAVLIAYDFARGAADRWGDGRTLWHPQADLDRWLFLGHQPTVLLQEWFKAAEPGPLDVAVTLTYVSFFFAPYVLAGVLWWRSRAAFRSWALRYLALSLLGVIGFTLVPAAPPWAAAACTPSQVAGHPVDPRCLASNPAITPDGGLLGPYLHPYAGGLPWVQRLSARGWEPLHQHIAAGLLREGQAGVDLVAAIPSLHAGGTLLVVLFLWPRASRLRRARWVLLPVLTGYVLFMAFALVYAAEHYVTDILIGWALAVVITVGADRLERPRKYRAVPDTLVESVPVPTGAPAWEPSCPPIATNPSSTSPSDAVSSSPPARSTGAPAPPGTTVRSASS